jgi:hypothetical protein
LSKDQLPKNIIRQITCAPMEKERGAPPLQ